MPSSTRSGVLATRAPAPTATETAAETPAETPTAEPGLSAYELERLANIRANEAILASLNLVSFKSEMGLKSSSARPSQRGVANASRKRSSSTPTVPTRQSSRTRNVAPEFSGVAEEHRDGRIELDSGDIIAPGVGKVARPEDLFKQLDPRTPIPFHRVNDDDMEEAEEDVRAEDVEAAAAAMAAKDAAEEEEEEEEDVPLSARLPPAARAAAAALPKPDERDGALLRLVTSGQEGGSREEAPRQMGRPAGKGRGAAKPPAAASSLARCSLAEADVAKVSPPVCGLAVARAPVHRWVDKKQEASQPCAREQVTKSAVVHLQFQPRDDTLLLAAGDKDGHVSLWHCDRAEDDPSDGVHLHRPHKQYICGLR